jgi:hypothetical protein
MHYGGAEKLREIELMFETEIGLEASDICEEYSVRPMG